MELELAILFCVLAVLAAWACARANSWAERFVQLVALAMAALGVFAVAGLVYLQLTGRNSTPPILAGPAQPNSGRLSLAILSLLVGGLAGAVFSYLVHLRPKEQADTAIQLLREAMRVQGLKEAWIVEAIDTSGRPDEASAQQAVLTKAAPLSEKLPGPSGGCYLRKVELRGVLDKPDWRCADNDPFYDRLGVRRAWVVRDHLLPDERVGRAHRPALVSSAAIEELVAWMEQVAAARRRRLWGVWGRLLTNDGARSIWAPLLFRVVKEDILTYVSDKPRRLSPDARRILTRLGTKLREELGDLG